MRPQNIKKLLKYQLEHGSNPDTEFGSIFLWGPPGIGKSRIVEDVAKELCVRCIDFRLILCDPTDLRGLPMPITMKDSQGNETTSVIWVPPDELPREGAGFLLFDDFLTAPPLVQGASYQIAIRPHQLGPYHLPERYVIVAASNRIEDRALVHKMPTALANRFRHIELDVNIDDWVDWALTHGIDPIIIGFLKWRPELLFKFDPESAQSAFPTPRTWEAADRGLSLPKALMVEVLEGTVGAGAAAEFVSFLQIQKELPDLNIIFEGDNFVPKSISLKYALVSALASRAKSTQFNRLIQYSEHLPEEFSVLLMLMLTSKDEAAVRLAPSFPQWVKGHKDLIVSRSML